ncbi:TfpX/TfpZ family type IV pilin accessory protein [Psychrobacter immobilis]|uniref:TfpX/TfpZ family type IV pilin accessory protein n=1 Tax=Psychrobacter immobilis TaxID=498 RepID=UPI003FD559FC
MSFYTASRWALARYHLLFSTVLSAIIAALIYLVWYPSPLHLATDVLSTVLLLVAINLIVPPLLTVIVYKADKKELMRDIVVIAAVQIAALLYGLFVIAQGRPAYLVFAIDDFEVVRPADVQWAKQTTAIEVDNAPKLGLFNQPKLVYSPFSADKNLRGLEQTEELTHGISITYRVDSYQPIMAAANVIKAKAQPLLALNNYNDTQQVNEILNLYPNADGWLALKAPVLDMVVLTDSKGAVIDVVNLRPWGE